MARTVSAPRPAVRPAAGASPSGRTVPEAATAAEPTATITVSSISRSIQLNDCHALAVVSIPRFLTALPPVTLSRSTPYQLNHITMNSTTPAIAAIRCPGRTLPMLMTPSSADWAGEPTAPTAPPPAVGPQLQSAMASVSLRVGLRPARRAAYSRLNYLPEPVDSNL